MLKNICNIFSPCSERTTSVNYAKQVDAPTQNYGIVLGDVPQQNSFRQTPKPEHPSCQMCLPIPAESSYPKSNAQSQSQSIIQVPSDTVKSSPKLVCEPCKPPSPTDVWLNKSNPVPQKMWLNRLLMFLLSVCLPVCDSTNQGRPVAKLMVCLPCPPPISYAPPKHQTNKVCSFPFAVPQKLEGELPQKSTAKYLPPPERRICSPSCIHKDDLKGHKDCTWHAGIPCVAHCYSTPLKN